MQRSSFFNAVISKEGVPDRSYLAEDFARYFSTFIGNGVFPNPSSQLQVVATDNNMNIRLKKGFAWINGYMYENTDDYILSLDVADGVLDRIDRVVLRLDFLKRTIEAVIKKGDWSSTAKAKDLQRDSDAYEIALADIKISKGAISISQEDITDLRLNKSLCGIVHGVVDQVDTTSIFNQFENWYSNTKDNYDKDITTWTKEKKEAFEEWYKKQANLFKNWFDTNTGAWTKEFNTWFDNLKSQLDENITTKLLTRIQKLEKDTSDLNDQAIQNKTDINDIKNSKGEKNGLVVLDEHGHIPQKFLSTQQSALLVTIEKDLKRPPVFGNACSITKDGKVSNLNIEIERFNLIKHDGYSNGTDNYFKMNDLFIMARVDNREDNNLSFFKMSEKELEWIGKIDTAKTVYTTLKFCKISDKIFICSYNVNYKQTEVFLMEYTGINVPKLLGKFILTDTLGGNEAPMLHRINDNSFIIFGSNETESKIGTIKDGTIIFQNLKVTDKKIAPLIRSTLRIDDNNFYIYGSCGRSDKWSYGCNIFLATLKNNTLVFKEIANLTKSYSLNYAETYKMNWLNENYFMCLSSGEGNMTPHVCIIKHDKNNYNSSQLDSINYLGSSYTSLSYAIHGDIIFMMFYSSSSGSSYFKYLFKGNKLQKIDECGESIVGKSYARDLYFFTKYNRIVIPCDSGKYGYYSLTGEYNFIGISQGESLEDSKKEILAIQGIVKYKNNQKRGDVVYQGYEGNINFKNEGEAIGKVINKDYIYINFGGK